MKVAVVDDEKLFREYLVHTMDWDRLGCEVCWVANDGEEALEKALHSPPDIMLVDINMPFMDGLTLTQHLRERHQQVEIVLVTGIDTFDCARKAIKLGVKDYLLKPFSNEEFYETLSAIKNSRHRGMKGVVDGCNTEGKKAFYPWSFYKELIVGLRTSQRELIAFKLDWLFEDMSRENIATEYLQTTVQTLVAICLAHLTEAGRGIEEVYGTSFRPSDVLKSIEDLDGVKSATMQLFDQAILAGKEKKALRSDQIVERALLMIHEQYANEDLSLLMLSKSVYVNESYFRSVFKKKVGMTVTDYITQVRMDAAKRLIETGGKKFSEICYEVGYKDPAYFSKCFKRHFGVSPSSFETIHGKCKKPSNPPLSSYDNLGILSLQQS